MNETLAKELSENNAAIAKVQAEMTATIKPFNTRLQELQAKDSELRKSIREAMEQHDVKKFENDFVSVTYIAPTTRKSFDSTKFKEEKPELFEAYTKTSEVQASVRIKVK